MFIGRSKVPPASGARHGSWPAPRTAPGGIKLLTRRRTLSDERAILHARSHLDGPAHTSMGIEAIRSSS